MSDEADGERPDFPPGIGPHNLRELELMLAGAKPAAMFSDAITCRDIIPEEDFAPHVAAGRIVKREVILKSLDHHPDSICIYYALPGEEWRIDALHAICEALHFKRRRPTLQDHIDHGRLLGYSADEIAAYIKHTKLIRPAATPRRAPR